MRGMGPEQSTPDTERSLRDYYQPARPEPEFEPDDARLAFRETMKAGGVEAARAAAAQAEEMKHPSFPDDDIPEV
jgi:hypothetical protein